jgi:hypothetical protein
MDLERCLLAVTKYPREHILTYKVFTVKNNVLQNISEQRSLPGHSLVLLSWSNVTTQRSASILCEMHVYIWQDGGCYGQFAVLFTFTSKHNYTRARNSVVGWGTMLQAGRSPVRVPDKVIGFFNWPSPSRRTTALGSTQLLTEMSTRNLPGAKDAAGAKDDNLTAICEPIF